MSDPLLNQIGGGPIGSRSVGTRVLEVVCAALLAIMVILLFIQVFGRYALELKSGKAALTARGSQIELIEI